MTVRNAIGNLLGRVCGLRKKKTEPPQVVQAHCNKCGHDTNHYVVTERRRQASEWVSPDYEINWSTTHDLLECKGCEEISLCRTEWCSEDHPLDQRTPTYFPPRVSRRKPAWVSRHDLPDEYASLLDEVYTALHADSRRLAAMGARTLIDIYIVRRVGDQGNFGNGLKKLVTENYISEANREVVSAAVDAGNASAHRGHCPSAEDINVVIDIVENLIQNELLGEQAQTLRANTPPRPKPGAASAQKNP